jgi:hypothetical protein
MAEDGGQNSGWDFKIARSLALGGVSGFFIGLVLVRGRSLAQNGSGLP